MVQPMTKWREKIDKTPIGLATTRNDRGMRDLLSALSGDPARKAARDLLEARHPIVICTGFPVNGMPETDGPPGAFALLDALRTLGKNAKIASWPGAVEIFSKIRRDLDYVEVPVGSTKPALQNEDLAIVTIEICGQAIDGTYRNMRGLDISATAPRFELVFGTDSLMSVGDGGNEFGMGSAPGWFFETHSVMPPISHTKNLIPASTSNYGAYATIKELEWAAERRLLPNPNEHIELITALVEAGCVDGFSGESKLAVDGRSLGETLDLLKRLTDPALTPAL
jgi:hypothetical protein